MSRIPKTEKVLADLACGKILPLSESDWVKLAGSFSTVDIIPTGMAGEILLVQRPLPDSADKKAWALVEEPEAGKRVIRPFEKESDARALIADRLAAYERMWDG